MHLLEIAAAQPAFQNSFGILISQTPAHGKVLSRPFVSGNEKRLSSAWQFLGITKNFNFNLGRHEVPSGRLLIKAVATLEPKCKVNHDDKHTGQKNSRLGIDRSSPTVQTQTQSSGEDSGDLDEKERLRRMRISKANKGNTPWNKGRKHSPETLQRIRERTRIAMQDPKVKMKLVNLGHAQSEETRIKIGVGVRMGWQRRRKKLYLQETCYFEWQNLIAEASRQGFDGEEELQWNSYQILNEQLQKEWTESVEKRKSMPRPKGSKRAPKSPEQRRKISEAISLKWADPGYRDRVVSALAQYHGIPPGTERKPRRRPTDGSQSPRRSPAKKKVSEENNPSYSKVKTQTPRPKRKRGAPLYKDPLASSKLEMIKNIRAQRATAETKKIEAIERARLLIAEAEKAAKALEIAAAKSPIARASLLETRKLIAEAVRSLESIEAEQNSFQETGEDPLVELDELGGQVENETDTAGRVPIEADRIKLNGTQTLASSKEKDFNFGTLNLQDILNGEEGLLPIKPHGYGLSPFSYETLIKQSDSRIETGQLEPNRDNVQQGKPLLNGAKVETPKEETPAVETSNKQTPASSVTVTKKWIRGRLVEVAEGAA
ncbi:Nuclease associated modular domain [Trema orientale]|uniref:Nuclease associated modular domain n=1 Tax=Trema orientale TaxID=63057 RepID=A0A2P5DY98_TREOI|nr:Nuclease associated modular domain [Trema orientale]